MANEVYANGREISCKAADGKSICAFPDVCMSPPSPPAGPIPIPYPNTAFAKDTTSGSKSVKISGKEVMLRNKSYYKKSTGDEAATKSFGMGVITHQITGKVYFASWSPDVKFEGQNVVRHLDMTTHNHASATDDGGRTLNQDSSAKAKIKCDEVLKKYPVKTYDELKNTKKGFQAHHVIQNSHFQYPRGTTLRDICPGYTEEGAPCILLEDGTDPKTSHGRASQMQKADAKEYRKNYREKNISPDYSSARNDSKEQLTDKPVPGLTESEAECVLKEVDKFFKKMCGEDFQNLKLRPPGQRGKGLPKEIQGTQPDIRA